jgi:hypothetical protein
VNLPVAGIRRDKIQSSWFPVVIEIMLAFDLSLVAGCLAFVALVLLVSAARLRCEPGEEVAQK